MASSLSKRPHAVCVPFPTQGHMNPLLSLAKVLHANGFYITFVLSEYNKDRLIRSKGPDSVRGLPDFRFVTIPDGLPYSDNDETQNVPDLCESTMNNCLDHFRDIVTRLNEDISETKPPVSCIVADGAMTFTLDVAQELHIPEILFWTVSACAFLAYLHFQEFVDKGIIPLKDEAESSSGILDTEVDWISGLRPGVRLKDFPSFLHVNNVEDKMFSYILHETNRSYNATAIVLNTFEDLEATALQALRKKIPPVYAFGPLSLVSRNLISNDSPVASITTSLWKENTTCPTWLDGKTPRSVVYVNFGSVTKLERNDFEELAWGIAESGYHFIWVIRPDLVNEESSKLSSDFLNETRNRGLLPNWCDQEEVLRHPAVGAFLTHCGWNSTLESLTAGVPMICLPFVAEQKMNCLYSCTDWGVGEELSSSWKRTDVANVIREMMGGDKGRRLRVKAEEWKESAALAVSEHGSSSDGLEKTIKVLRDSENLL